MGMPAEMVLVRHGQSEANVIQKKVNNDRSYEIPEGFHDRHDSEMVLTARGIEQAIKTGEWIRKEFPEGFDFYFTSPHNRALKTAGLLALNGNWKVDDRWRERDWGEYGILNDEEREQRYELSHKLYKQNRWYWCPPGGESLATEVRLRMEDVLDTLHREADGKNVIAVSHGETIEVYDFIQERLLPQEWLKRNKDDKYNLANCQTFNFSRVDPNTGLLGPKVEWLRSICAWDNSKSWNNGEWINIPKRTFSDSDLIEMADSFVSLLPQVD